MASPPEDLTSLFDAAKAKYPSTLPHESWYLVAASALVTCSNPLHFGQLWLYLTQQPEHATDDQRRALNKRLREFVMKQWLTIGVPKAATALFALIQEERPGDADLGFSKSHIGLNASTRQKGTDFLLKLYGPARLATLTTTWGADFDWLTKDVVYGMFYADESVLGDLETELITYTAIACQGLKVTVENHLGGLLRMGLSVGEVEAVTGVAEVVARWSGGDMRGWVDVGEVAGRVGGGAGGG